MKIVIIILFFLLVLSGCSREDEKAVSNAVTLSADPIEVDISEDVKALGYSGQRKIVEDGEGNTYVAYRKKFGKRYEIFVAKVSREGEVSQTSKPIAVMGEFDQRVPSIDIDNKGILHVVWYGSVSQSKNNRQILYSRSVDKGNSWSQPIDISQIGGYDGSDMWQEHPDIEVADSGEVFVVWEGRAADEKEQQIKFVSSPDGGVTWTAWKNAKPLGGSPQSRPTIVESGGTLHLFMYSSGGTKNQKIWHASSYDQGETWSDWEVISDPNFASKHISASEDDGTLHVVWRAEEEAGSRIKYLQFDKDGRSDIMRVSDSGNFQFFPSISVCDGKVFVAWMESDDPGGLPSEDPQDGAVYIARLADDDFTASRIGQGLYPVLPARCSVLPIAYEFKQGNEYIIRLEAVKK